MKAKEYFEKYYAKDLTDENVGERSLEFFKELIVESGEIAKQRKVKLESSLSAVFKEQQQKVNAVNRLFKKKYDSNLFQEEAFIRFARTQLRKFSHLI